MSAVEAPLPASTARWRDLAAAMWFSRFSLLRREDLEAWIGLMVVLQNVFSSLFNSHLFDFHEGSM